MRIVVKLASLVLAVLPLLAHAGPLDDAYAAMKRGDYEAANALLRPLADAGDVDALGNLGNAYGFARGVPQDLVKARDYWEKAAEKHFGPAMFNIAVLYWKGQGVPKDEAVAAGWFRKAAEHGHVQAMIALSSIYALGRGLPSDGKQALAWASLANTSTTDEKQKSTASKQMSDLLKTMSAQDKAETQTIMADLRKVMDANIEAYRKQ